MLLASMEHIKNKREKTPSNPVGRDTTNTSANAQGISTGDHKRTDTKECGKKSISVSRA